MAVRLLELTEGWSLTRTTSLGISFYKVSFIVKCSINRWKTLKVKLLKFTVWYPMNMSQTGRELPVSWPYHIPGTSSLQWSCLRLQVLWWKEGPNKTDRTLFLNNQLETSNKNYVICKIKAISLSTKHYNNK